MAGAGPSTLRRGARATPCAAVLVDYDEASRELSSILRFLQFHVDHFSHSQHLERLVPMASCKRCDDPDHGGGFEVVREPDPAHIDGIPTEVFANPRDLFLC